MDAQLTIELHPGDTRACVSINVSSVDERISFLVQSDELEIINPDGIIFGKYVHVCCLCYHTVQFNRSLSLFSNYMSGHIDVEIVLVKFTVGVTHYCNIFHIHVCDQLWGRHYKNC